MSWRTSFLHFHPRRTIQKTAASSNIASQLKIIKSFMKNSKSYFRILKKKNSQNKKQKSSLFSTMSIQSVDSSMKIGLLTILSLAKWRNYFIWSLFMLNRSHRCWSRMATKCVGDNYRMLVTLLVANIHDLLTNRHQF